MNQKEAEALWQSILEFAESVADYQSEYSSEFYEEETANKYYNDMLLQLNHLSNNFRNTGYIPMPKKHNSDIDTVLKNNNWAIAKGIQ